MGQHVWLLLATIVTELLVITKWSKGQYPAPFPPMVKWGWVFGITLLVLYPTVQVSYNCDKNFLVSLFASSLHDV